MRYSIVLISLAGIIASCADLGSGDLQIVDGQWFQQERIEIFLYKYVWTFNPNRTFTIVRSVHDPFTNTLLGYRFKSERIYNVVSSILIMTTKREASNDDTRGPYSVELVPMPVNRKAVQNEFRIESNTLTIFYGPCPPNANCIDRTTLQRFSR